jgi:predicted dehydrogenase
MKLRIGVAGLRRGAGFVRLFSHRKDCQVVAVCDQNPDRCNTVAEEVHAQPFGDYDEFCRQELDAVVIITPPSTHFSCTAKALDAGKHVLCEIPSVFSLEEAEQLAEKVARSGLKYMAGENVCYLPVIQKMHDIVREGLVGDVLLAEGEYIHDCRDLLYNCDDGLGGGTDTKPSWRDALQPIQYSTHELGPLLMILDDRIVSVSCMDSTFPTQDKYKAVNTQIALFKTAAGRTIRELVAFKISREPGHHFYCLYGTKGSVETDRYRWCENLKLYSERTSTEKNLSDIPTSLVHPDAPPEAQAGGHGTCEYYMIDDFVRSILDDTQPFLDVRKALDMTVPGICAAESARQDGRVIPVPDIIAK